MKITADRMKNSALDAETLLKALANRHRLMILCQLIDAERAVGELAEFLSLRDSTVSQHLALLRKDGLVATRVFMMSLTWCANRFPSSSRISGSPT